VVVVRLWVSSRAGFEHAAALEIDPHACATLAPETVRAWKIFEGRHPKLLRKGFPEESTFWRAGFRVPRFQCPASSSEAMTSETFSQMRFGSAAEIEPRAVMLENVPGFASPKFTRYRSALVEKFRRLGYSVQSKIINACDFGVAQLRPRFVLVALREKDAHLFDWPRPVSAT